jgi:long-chain fatty acid transport protein
VSGQAFRFQSQSASAAGQGNVFAADASDASALHYNPAGMTQLSGVQFAAGTGLVGASITYKSPTGIPTKGDFGGSVAIPPPSHGFVTVNFRDIGITAFGNLSAGLGITTPFGLQTRYPIDGPFRTAVTSVSLPLIDIKPTLAYRLTETLSLGLGADIYTFASFLGQGHVEERFIWPGGGGISPGTGMEINGNGTAAGFNASLLYTPFCNSDGKPLANIGLVYRSQATLRLNGQFLANGGLVADAKTTVVLPQVYTGAIALWPVRDAVHEWKLEVDIDYVGWKSVRNLDTRLSNGGTIPQPTNWKNVVVLLLGTEYRWLNPGLLPDWDIALRAGYSYTQSPIPDSTFNPGILGLDLHEVSVGSGWTCMGKGYFLGLIPCAAGPHKFAPKAIGLDVAYRGWFFEPHTVMGNNNPTVNGTYQAIAHVGIVTMRLSF